jgi:hypothetical protein
MRGRVRRALHQVTRSALAHRRGLAIGLGVLVAAAVAFRVARHGAGFWAIDDAGITYAAAFEYADHGSRAAYVEGVPVESYSNPLVFFTVAALRRLALFDPVATHLRLEMIVFAMMVVIVWTLLRRVTGELAAVIGAAVFTATELCAAPTWLWYGSGLENVWVSAGLVTLLWICVRTGRGVALAPAWGAVAFVAALTRPEAPVYVAGFYLALAVCARPPSLGWRAHARQVAAALAVTTLLYAAFLCWRRVGYGDWLPNTYYAKIVGERQFAHNLRVSVIANILPYARSWLFASAAIVLAVIPAFRRIGAALLVLLIASLALPITAGEDWSMGGGHRFATPFLAMCHAAFAVLAAVCAAALAGAPRRRGRLVAAAGLLVIAGATAQLLASRLRHASPKLNDVTIARIGAERGGERWEHQMRLGVPYAVTMIPDAGGALLVGGIQMIDDAYLADFVMAHMGRYVGDPAVLRQVNQYQHEERRPDLSDDSTAIGVLDTAYLGTRYLAGAGTLLARRDLVVVPVIDPGARRLFDDGHLQVYLSDETVPTAAPGALVRCELIIAWDDPAALDHAALRGAIDGGDRDEISLRPYQPGARGIERRALLLGAPARVGPAAATIELVRDGRVIAGDRSLALDVCDDDAAFAAAADQIAPGGPAMRAARRLAWLREQLVPRFGMIRFHQVVHELLLRDARHGSLAGDSLLQLRWNARLASFERVPPAIRAAEVTVARRLFATCPAAAPAAPANRIACLGRVVDELRRLGYLGLVARVPEIADELARARDELDRLPPAQRYQALVGLTLADPSRIALQRDLIALRRELPQYPDLPSVTDRSAR